MRQLRPWAPTGLALLVFVGALTAQEPSVCSGEGAQAPGWYAEPPTPPAGVYQAEARSGGCDDAASAQKVAARLASWLLVHERSRQALMEQVLRRQQRTERGGDLRRSQTARIVERATLKKVLERSWVVRQETRWTEAGKAEHFLVARADTAALRSVAGEAVRTDLPDTELAAVDARRSGGPEYASQRTSARPSLADVLERVSSPGPPLRRLVLSWETKAAGRDLAFMDRPQRAVAGLRLTAQQASNYAALGFAFRQRRPRTYLLSQDAGDVHVGQSRTAEVGVLFGVLGQAVPLYGGYRYRWFESGSWDGPSQPDRDTEAGFLGLGVPPFAELASGRLRSLYLQAAAAPRLTGLGGGGRVTVARLPGSALLLRLAGRVERVDLGPASASRGEVHRYLDRTEAEAGLELELGRTISLAALGRLTEAEVRGLGSALEPAYNLLFADLPKLSPTERDATLRVGVRLVF